jgi:hypothetical protein
LLGSARAPNRARLTKPLTRAARSLLHVSLPIVTIGMDLSLDQIIKNTATANKKPAGGAAAKAKAAKQKATGKAPGGKKGLKMKLTGGIGKNKKGAKMKTMDVEMGGVKSGKKKGAAGKKKGPVGKLADTLQARIAAAKQRLGGKLTAKRGTPTKAQDIKITIAGKGGGAPAMKAPGGFKFLGGGGGGGGKGGGRGSGRGGGRGGGGLMAMIRGRGGKQGRGGGGSIVKPGMQQSAKKAPGTPRGGPQGIGKKAGKGGKARKVMIGALGGGKNKAQKGKGGNKGGNKNTLAAKFRSR